jgi:hypothetical protein
MTRHRHETHSRRLFLTAVGLALLTVTAPSLDLQAHVVSEWTQAENLGADVNSAFEDFAPHLSSDGLALYLTSNRSESLGGEDLWVARRASRYDAWGPALNLGTAINTAANERSPALSLNGRLLFFATDRPGGSGGFDIWLSWRLDPNDDLGWQPPVNVGSGINSAATDAGPSFLERRPPLRMPQLFFGSARPGGLGGLDIYVGSVPGGWSGPPLLIAELSSPQLDITPAVRRDGLEIIISSTRPGTLGGFDLWRSVRKSVDKPWSMPESLGPTINTEFLEAFPALSLDGRTLLFQSARPGGVGGSDLYMSTRW